MLVSVMQTHFSQMWVFKMSLTRSLREPGGPCTKPMEVSESRMERVKRTEYIKHYLFKPTLTCIQNVFKMYLTRSLREPGGPCTKPMEVSESRMEWVKRTEYIKHYLFQPTLTCYRQTGTGRLLFGRKKRHENCHSRKDPFEEAVWKIVAGMQVCSRVAI